MKLYIIIYLETCLIYKIPTTRELQITIEKANKEMGKLLTMDKVRHALVPFQIKTVESLVVKLICDYNYTPKWKDDYDRICDSYFEPIRVRNTEYISASDISFPFSYN